MTELSKLISRLKKDLAKKSKKISTIRHPELLIHSLQELQDLIGNEKLKDQVAAQISHLITMKERALNNSRVKEDSVMLNTLLYGPPGVGKTLIGTKLAKIWYSLGYLDGAKNPNARRAAVLQNLYTDNSNTGSSQEEALGTFFLFFGFFLILMTVLSMGRNFYNNYGAFWLLIVLGLLIFIIFVIYFYNYWDYYCPPSSSSSNKNNVNNCNNGACSNTNGNPVNNNAQNSGQIIEETESEFKGRFPPDEEIITILSRADFVDKYVGWSDKKTLKVLQANLGKVVFVDEAYSLVTDVHDSFGIEVLTTINLFLSQHPREIIVIFAGYEDLIKEGIFSVQPGLQRRFMNHFDCSGYTPDELFEIYKMQLKSKGWGLTDEEASKELFRENPEAFPNFGGDVEKLTFYSEVEHSRDYLGEENIPINLLSPKHVSRGINSLKDNNIKKKSNRKSTNPLANLMQSLREGRSNQDSESAFLESLRRGSDSAYH